MKGNKIVVHSYNSTQNMKVEGKGYIEFIKVFLEPYFKQILSNLDPKIEQCNRRIIKDLGKPQIRRSTRYKPVSEFKCKTCASNFLTHRQLAQHKEAIHMDSFNLTRNSDQTNSSNDNSVIEQLMLEDLSLTNISTTDKTSLQETVESVLQCEPCGFNTKSENDFLNHVGTHHGEEDDVKDKIDL